MPKDKMPQVCFFGDRVGKTSLIKRAYFDKESFQENENTTVGFDVRTITEPKALCVTEVGSNSPNMMKFSNVVVLCVDLINPGDIQQQYDTIKKNAPNATILIAGTKDDVEPNEIDKVKKFAKGNKITCVITSAKDNKGLVELRHAINQNLIYNQHQSEIERVKHNWLEATAALRVAIQTNPRFSKVLTYLDTLEGTLNKQSNPEQLNAAIHNFKTKSDKALGSESEVLKNKVTMVVSAALLLVAASAAIGLSVVGILTAPMGLGVAGLGVASGIAAVALAKKTLDSYKSNRQIAEDKHILGQPLEKTEPFKP